MRYTDIMLFKNFTYYYDTSIHNMYINIVTNVINNYINYNYFFLSSDTLWKT